MTIDRSAFERDGYAGLFRAVDPARMPAYRAAIDEMLATPGPEPRSQFQSRHLDCPAVLELCTASAITQRVHALLGPDILLWRSHFFPKEPGAPELDWHRDCDVWGSLLDPMVNVTAWLAIDDATRENGCVEIRPHPDTDGAIAMDAAAGECFLFDHALRHRSRENRSARRRLGLAVRFTVPSVRIDPSRLFADYRPIPIRQP